ncbi:MAG: S9 family peptidase [Burkholderiales bacterium]
MPITAPYATWKSPIATQLISGGAITLGLTAIDGDTIYWLESRPNEGGRQVLMRRNADGVSKEITPAPFNIRSRVHEYGGGAYAVKNGVIYFCHYADQRIYKQSSNHPPAPITPEGAWRYADMQIDLVRNRLICVREDHSEVGKEAVNELVSINLLDGQVSVIVSGADFYSSPRLSPDGRLLTWISWNHPDMPWDATELWLADFTTDNSLGEPLKIAGDNDESIAQPEWSPHGMLYFVSDKTGWWNIYRHAQQQIQAVCPMQAEFAYPHWQSCMSHFGFSSVNEIVCAYNQSGTWQLGKIHIESGKLETIPTGFTDIQYLRVERGQIVFHAASPTQPPAIVMLDANNNSTKMIQSSISLPFDENYISSPQSISFASKGKRTAHGFFYPPCNPDFSAPENQLPPLIVISHGGPTAAASTALKLSTQFWTSRGFAVLDVNYAGSTGYGREYRRSLYGLWGIADVEDCIAGAEYLVQQKLVDGKRLIIRGSSAGGYTTLCALTFHKVFRAAASYYGISDVAALAQDTHKFESRYEARLIGGLSEALYRSRSPIHYAEQLSCPVIFFQGLEDKVVLPNQTKRMVDALKHHGLPVAYLPFEGEQHGFRKAETIKRALEAELYFYSKVFGFELADEIAPVEIFNLQ